MVRCWPVIAIAAAMGCGRLGFDLAVQLDALGAERRYAVLWQWQLEISGLIYDGPHARFVGM